MIKKYLVNMILILSLTLAVNAGEIGDIWSNNPSITVTDIIEVSEGNSGTKDIQVTVSVDKCPDRANITLNYSTHDNIATTADNDYESKSGTITFNVNNCTKTQTVNFTINGDTKVEDDEYFYIGYDVSTMPYQNYHFNNGQDVTHIYILNDDGVVLDAGKYLVDENGDYKDSANYEVNDTITFVIIAQNQGPNSTKINVRDDLTDAIEFIPGSLKIINNIDNYSCSENDNKIRCSGDHIFNADEEVDIEFKAKALKEGAYDNYAYITDDKGQYENGDHVNFNINNVGDGVAIQKSVDKSTVEAGENVNFTIKITNNTPEERQLKIRDWFPTTQRGEDHSKTTKNAFQYISSSVIDGSQYGVTCEYKNNSYGPYVFCKNDLSSKLKPGESYTVQITAKVLKTGRLCNSAHAYLANDTYMSQSKVCLSSNGNAAPIIDELEDKSVYVGDNFSYDLSDKVSDPDGDPVTISVSGLPSGFTYNESTKTITSSPVTANEGTYTVTVSATDDPSSHGGEAQTVTKTFNIIVKYQTIEAKDNDYEIGMNETLEGNVITDNTGKGVDEGYNLKISNYEFLTDIHGSFSIDTNGKFRYKPDQDFQGTVKFNYTIKDAKNETSTALVTITVKTQYSSKFEEFKLINPLETRNIIGNYVIAGNSVECVTDKTDNFDGTCQNDRLQYYNNHYIVKYIDIDNSSKTWNSSSASFTLPDSYMPSSDGKNIVWAGLFWQGNVNNSNNFTKNGETYQNVQRRSYANSDGSVSVKDIDSNEALDILSTSANKVLVKIDNESSYHEIEASRFYYDSGDYGDNGATYAAYADITNLLQSKKLNKGKHTVTVANILTNEGLEQLNGDYGGWSIVVIYKEDFINGRARNISIYNGFTAVDGTTHGSQQVQISGFKLPKEGTVNSQFSVFAGEGELKYGDPYIDPDTNKTMYDTMRLKRLESDEGDIMPGADNADNIFDAKLANIQRDSGNNNDIENTNGIDIDTYDVSDIMTKYRDADNNISSVYVYIDSNKDYITPSMIAFSTELYAPKVCYDSDVKIGEYIDIDTQDRNFTAYNYNQALQMKVMIKSQEADFDLLDTKLRVDFEPNDVFAYIPGNSKTSYPNTYEYHNAIDTNPSIGEIAIGESATTEGGILKAKELVYSKMYYNFNKDYFEGKFDVVVDAKVSFDGVHKVEYQLSTKAPEGSIFNIPKCESNPVYNPVYGMFNIERGDSTFSQSEEDRYSLYTQVVGVPYEVSVAAYEQDDNGKYTKEANFDGTVELELIDASTFDNNSSSGFDSICNDPDTYNEGAFIKFHNKSRVKVKIPQDFPKINGKTTYPENLALKNAAFRVWILTKKDNQNRNRQVVRHNCQSQSDSACFKTLYQKEFSYTNACDDECGSGSGGKTCYECMRRKFAVPICSRDNFAIRPVSYDINIADDNETHSTTTKVNIAKNSSLNSINLAAGYLYHLDINATKFSTTRERAYGYYLKVKGDKGSKKALALFDDSLSCFDKNNTNVNIQLFNGATIGFESLSKNPSSPLNGLIINNSGKYQLYINDSDWTKVDQKGYIYKPFKNHEDCIGGSTEINNGSLNALRGCKIESNDTVNGYYNLHLSMHPYSFNISSLNAASNPDTGADFIYINDINDTKNLVLNQSVMAINIKGLITAVGKNGLRLSNYTNNCSANNLNIKINYDTLKDNNNSAIIKDIIGNNVNMLYTIYNPNIDSNATVLKSLSKQINIDYNKRYFDDNNTTAVLGSSMFNAYLNFERSFNGAINPFILTFGDFSVASSLDKSNVDLVSNHIPNITKDLNSSKMVYYAKVKSESDFYDDVYENSINTPVMVTIFCNETLDKCEKYGINTNKDATNEYDWWISKNHSAIDGKAILRISNSSLVSITPSTIENFVDGIDKNVIVKDEGLLAKPFTAIIVPTIDMINNYPWLLFNSFEDKVPDSIFKVRFVKPTSAWSGKGKTGHTIEVKSSGRKSNKVSW